MVELWICLFKVLQDFYYDCESKSQDSEYGKYVNMGGLHRIFDSSKLVEYALKLPYEYVLIILQYIALNKLPSRYQDRRI